MTTTNPIQLNTRLSEPSEETETVVTTFDNALRDIASNQSFEEHARLLSEMAGATAMAHEETLALKQDLSRAKQLAMEEFESQLNALRVRNSEIQRHAIEMQQEYEPLREERDILRRERDSLLAEVKYLRVEQEKGRSTFLSRFFFRTGAETDGIVKWPQK